MQLREVARLSFEALLANRFRAALTMLGMVIGVGSVILLVSIGTGAKRYILNEFEGLGSNLIMVQPGRTDKKSNLGPPIGAAQRKMTIADIVALEKRAYNLEAVTGIVFGTATVKAEGSTSNVNVFGSNDLFTKILNFHVEHGAWFTREEDDYGRRVVLLGKNVSEDLFGDAIPLGKTVRINESEYRIIGIMGSIGDKIGMNFDEFVFVPTHAALRLFNDDKLFGIRAKARSKAGVDDAIEEIKEILKERRDGEEDFTIITQGAMLASMNTILSMLTYVLAAIAGISMLVGGIGIMNIMLVSVAERTSEIGIRRAVGARQRDILTQFLAESIVLSLIGCLTGLLGAAAITQIAHWFLPSFDLRPPGWIIAPTFFGAVAVGVIFGVWPARKASKIETLEALRYE